MEFSHVSVLLNECIEALEIKPDGIYVDCTAGGGGHSEEIAKRLSGGRLIAIDRDAEAIAHAGERLKKYGERVTLVRGNFRDLKLILAGHGISGADGILIDLGVSSYQLDEPERGFSYQNDARLDMRMDQSAPLDAWTVVNTYDEAELSRIFFQYGEERYSRRIAETIVKRRKEKTIDTTHELVDIIKASMPKKALSEKGHPAKRVFQAIRIEVNGELEGLEKTLEDIYDCLNPGGVAAIITFHSLEDRMVKQYFKKMSEGCTCPKSFPVCVCGNKPKLELMRGRSKTPTEEEIRNNSRSKSARLRAARRIL